MKIICFGDSNTYGYDPRSFLGGRYTYAWTDYLCELAECETVNLGENGREIPHTRAPLEWALSDIESNMPADKIAVLLGSNDILNGYRITAEEIAERMENFILALKKSFPDTELLLISVPKMNIPEEFIAQKLAELSQLYKAVAEKNSVAFFDLHSLELSLTTDGVHFTEESHKRVAEAVLEYL